MPLCTGSHNYFSFNRRLATLATRAEEFMEVEVAEKPYVGIRIGWHAFSLKAFVAFVCGFRVEGDALEGRGAVVTGEAFGVEHGF